jgi:hypothetical protein
MSSATVRNSLIRSLSAPGLSWSSITRTVIMPNRQHHQCADLLAPLRLGRYYRIWRSVMPEPEPGEIRLSELVAGWRERAGARLAGRAATSGKLGGLQTMNAAVERSLADAGFDVGELAARRGEQRRGTPEDRRA